MSETLGAQLAAVCAGLNATAAVLIGCGWRAIRRGQRLLHAKLMGSAFLVSALFLAVYLTRAALGGTRRYPGHGPLRTAYLILLFTHMVFAAATPPLVIRTVYLALKQRYAEHRRIVRFTLPVWLYVSVTGVLVYLMLYHTPT